MIRMLMRYCPNTISKFLTASYFKIGGTKQFHSLPDSVQFSNMKVKILPALKDNYMYLIIDEGTHEAAVVDPVEPSKVISVLEEEAALLKTVLITHHHWDHAGGNKKMLKFYPGVEIVGGDDRIDGLTKKVSHNDKLNIGNLVVQCLYTPCHTKGHMCYFIPQENEPAALFTGDTLFAAGCGRFFEGSGLDMYRALIEVLGKLPDSTRVFCGHEYTVNNLNFAKQIEPTNSHIQEHLKWALKQRELNKPTIPSTIGEEKKVNPFMRVCSKEVQKIVQNSDPVSVMTILRRSKDEFKGPLSAFNAKEEALFLLNE